MQEIGAQILDTRDPGEFAAAHLAGSINIGLGGQYATWAGTVLDREHPIVIIADPGRESESATRLGRIGFDHVAGYLQDGLHSLESRPELVASTERLSAPFAAELLSSTEPPLAIDVRAPRERDQKYIAGSVAMPLNHLAENLRKASERPSRCWSIARAATARPSPRACCSAADLLPSAKLPAASPDGKPRSSQCKPPPSRN